MLKKKGLRLGAVVMACLALAACSCEAPTGAQIRYIESLGLVLERLNVEMVNWVWLYPLHQAYEISSFWQTFR